METSSWPFAIRSGRVLLLHRKLPTSITVLFETMCLLKQFHFQMLIPSKKKHGLPNKPKKWVLFLIPIHAKIWIILPREKVASETGSWLLRGHKPASWNGGKRSKVYLPTTLKINQTVGKQTLTSLGGGFNHFLFSPLPGRMMQFDYIIFFKWIDTTS